MSLTKKDLLQMKSLIDHGIEENNERLISLMLETFPTKQDMKESIDGVKSDLRSEFRELIGVVQDAVVGLRQDFDRDFTIVTLKTVNDHDVEMGDLKTRVSKLETRVASK